MSPVGGKPIHVSFDSGRLTLDAGVLLFAEVERGSDWPSGWHGASPIPGRPIGSVTRWSR